MATTKFEMTMTIEVKDVGDVPANVGVVSNSAIKAIEAISSGDVVRVTNSHISQKTFQHGIDLKHKDETGVPVITAKKQEAICARCDLDEKGCCSKCDGTDSVN